MRIGGSHLRFTIFGTHTMCPQTLISDRRIASTATAGLSLPTNRLRTRTGHVWLRTRPGIERQPLRLDVVKVVEAGVQKGGGKDERRCEAMAIRDRDRSCFACGEMAAAIPNGEFGLSGFDSEHLTWEMCIHTKKPNRESMRLDRSPVCVLLLLRMRWCASASCRRRS